MKGPLIPQAWSALAPLTAFSSSVAGGRETMTPGLRPLFLALALTTELLALHQEETNCVNLKVLVI